MEFLELRARRGDDLSAQVETVGTNSHGKQLGVLRTKLCSVWIQAISRILLACPIVIYQSPRQNCNAVLRDLGSLETGMHLAPSASSSLAGWLL